MIGAAFARVTRCLVVAFVALAALFSASCSNPCDELVGKRCECGAAVCRAARDELKLSTELLRSLGGNGGRQVLAERCKERLAAFACPKD